MVNQLEKWRRRSKWWTPLSIVGQGVVFVGIILIVFRAYFLAPAVVQPSQPDLAGIDPAVREAIEQEIAQVKKEPKSAGAWGRLGCVFLANLFEDEARFSFEQAERLEPQNALWVYGQGLIWLSRDPALGLAKIEHAVNLAGNRVEGPRLKLADEYLAQGYAEKARQQYEVILANTPRHPRALLGLARIHFQQGELAHSLQLLDLPMADRRTRKSALAISAEIHQHQNQTKAANRDLAQMSELPEDPEWPDEFLAEIKKFKAGESARLQLAYELDDSGHAAEALEAARALVNAYPQSARSWAALGSVLLNQRKYVGAESALRKSISVDDGSPRTWVNLGLCRYQLGDMAEALVCFGNAIKYKPDYLQAHYNVGLCHKARGNRQAAIASFRNALRCQPLNQQIHVQLGELLLDEKQYKDAVFHLEQGVDLNPADANAQKLLDEARKRSGP
jgi:tetratricopeptide (TPR) repeat protein